jgi:hypothetical protein
MADEVVRLRRRDALNRRRQGLIQVGLGTGRQTAEDGFELGESQLNGIEIGRVGRDKQDLAGAVANQLGDVRRFVGRQIVEEDNLARLQTWRQNIADIDAKGVGGERAVEGDRRTKPLMGQRCQHRGGRAIVFRYPPGGALVTRSAGVASGQRDGGGRLIDRDNALDAYLGDLGAKGDASVRVLFAGCQCLFLKVQPRRRIVRHIPDTLSRTPWLVSHNPTCSAKVAS